MTHAATSPYAIKKPISLVCFIMVSLMLSACQAPVYAPSKPVKTQIPRKLPIDTGKTSAKPYAGGALTSAELQNAQPFGLHNKPQSSQPQPQQPVTAQHVLRRSQKRVVQKQKNIKDGRTIPAFNNLIKLGIKYLRSNNLDQAEQQFIKAQRIGPQSPAPYMYLSEIAIKRKRATQAENLARRGLLVSRSRRYDKALWKMIEISGRLRNRADVVAEALAELKKF